MSDIYDTYKYYNIFFRLLGLPSVRFVDKRAAEPRTRAKIYSCFVTVSFLISIVCSVVGKLNFLSEIGPIYVTLDHITTFFLIQLTIVRLIVPVLVHSNSLCVVLNRLMDFDKILTVPNRIRKEDTCIAVCMFACKNICCVFMMYYDVWAWTKYDAGISVYFVTKNLLIYVLTVSLWQIEIICLFIKRRFQLINHNCKKMSFRMCATGVESRRPEKISISVLRKTHASLCDITEIVNKIFGFCILGSILLIMIIILHTTYYYIIYVLNRTSLGVDNIEKELMYSTECGWIIYFSFLLYTFILVCETVSVHGNRTLVVVNKLLLESFVSHGMRDELKKFSKQVFDQAPRINASGFFTLNRALVSSLFGGLISYLVLLLQFMGLSGRALFRESSFITTVAND